MKRLIFTPVLGAIFLMGMSLSSSAETDGFIEVTKKSRGTLTFRDAMAKALVNNPELAAYSLEKRIREARTLQSGFLPNPELEITVGDVAGSGAFSGFNQSETTIQLGQVIELGGKRAARVQVSRLSEKLADWDYETKRMDILTSVSKGFIEVLKVQHKVSLIQGLVNLGSKFLNAVSERVKAGKVAPIEGTKAEVSLSSFKIELEKAKLELKNSRRRLSTLLGDMHPRFDSVSGDFFSVSTVPPLAERKERLANNPDLARWVTELEKRQATLDLELSKGIPDIKLKGGYRRLEETRDNTITFGISIPLQLFNRNQGAIAEARNQLSQIHETQRAVALKTTESFLQAYNTLVFSHSLVTSIKTQVLPGAQKAFESINEGYSFGKFGLLDVLDSQKTLFQVRGQYLDALANYHKAVADVERLTGEPLVSENQTPGTTEGKSQQ